MAKKHPGTIPSREWLKKLYIDQNLTSKDIMQLLNERETTGYIWTVDRTKHILKRAKLYKETHRTRGDIERQIALSEEERAIITGSALGDGSFEHKPNKDWRFTVTHANSQYEYLYWKYEKLSRLCLSGIRERISPYKKKDGTWAKSYTIRTVTHPGISEIGKLFFVNTSIKSISEDLYPELTELSLAIWYMDDGSLDWREISGTPFICTDNFNFEDIRLLQDMLWQKFNIKTSIYKYRSHAFSTSSQTIIKTAWRLRISLRSPFFDLISPYVIPSMQYKLPPKYRTIPVTEVKTIPSEALRESTRVSRNR